MGMDTRAADRRPFDFYLWQRREHPFDFRLGGILHVHSPALAPRIGARLESVFTAPNRAYLAVAFDAVLESSLPIEIPGIRRFRSRAPELALAVIPAGAEAVATVVRVAASDAPREEGRERPLAENPHADECVEILDELMLRVRLLTGEGRRESEKLREFRAQQQRELDTQRSRRAELLRAVERASIIQKLTARELQVFALVAKGLTNAQVASQLGISARTVETHRGHLMQKLDLDDFRALIVLATAHGYA